MAFGSLVLNSECPKRLIKHTVECLTTGRATSTCVQRHHVRKAWDKFEQSGEAHRSFKDEEVIQIKDEIRDWELFHDSKTQKKKPSDLRVCYLAGENPLNDLNVFIKNGVLSQNICAIEKNGEGPQRVRKTVMESRSVGKVQLFEGDFLECMQETDSQFDIIYFDATSSLTSKKQETLKAIGHVFLYNKLASPGALITTFSFPAMDTEDYEGIDLCQLAKGYLKFRLKNTTEHPSDLEEFVDSRSDEENYSDYITYQVIDTAYMYIPALRMLSSNSRYRKSLWQQLFPEEKRIFKDVETIDKHSSSFVLQMWEHMIECKDQMIEFFTDGVKNLDPSAEPPQNALLHLWTNSQENPYFKAGQNPHDLAAMLSFFRYGKIAHPSFIVPEKLLRLKHHDLHEGQMFSDVFIFDNCQYMFQQLPSVDYEYSAIFQPKTFWVVQTIAECLANKLGFIYRNDFDYCQSTTSDEPIEVPERKLIILTKDDFMTGLKYSKSLLDFNECLDNTENMNKYTPNHLRIGPRKSPFSRKDSLRRSCPERGPQHRVRWLAKELEAIILETLDPIEKWHKHFK